jgi:hypothetical protein
VAKKTRAARRSRAGAASPEAPAASKAPTGRARPAAGAPAQLTQDAKAAITGFAEELGRLLGAAQAKAAMWLEQRKLIADQLRGVRDTATRLMRQLGVEAEVPALRRRKRVVATASDAAPRRRRRRRRLSAETRRKMSEAAKARWAERKKQEG